MRNRKPEMNPTNDPRRFYLLGFVCCLFSATLCGYAAAEAWAEDAPAMTLLGGVEAVLAAFGAGVIGRHYRRAYGKPRPSSRRRPLNGRCA